MEISRNNAIPMYIQIAENLKQKIRNRDIKPGEKLGTQTELEELYNVSTITIRQALQLLTEEGLTISKQGKGTFVRTVKVEQELVELQSLSEIIEKNGYKQEVSILRFEINSTPEDISDIDEKCLYIERLHNVAEKKMALALIYLPYSIGSKFTIQDFKNHTVYHLLENKHNIKLGEAVQIIESVPATPEIAEKLDINPGSPLLKAERITFDKNNQPVEKIIFYYRHDEFSFKVRLPVTDRSTLWPINI